MARNKGQFQFAANFEVKAAAALDPRIVVEKKSELINKETWPYDGDTIYLYKGILVSVQEEKAVYMLVDTSKILNSDYSGWEKLGTDNTNQIEIVDNLTSNATDKALSANQGKVLIGKINEVTAKISSIYTLKGTVANYDSLPPNPNIGDVYNVDASYGELGDSDYVPPGTNFVYTADGWDALGGIVDLSNYYNKDEIADEIGEETSRAQKAEKDITDSLATTHSIATAANQQAINNGKALTSLSTVVGSINLTLNGNENDDNDGVIGRLEAVEDLIGTPTNEDKNSTMLSRLNALEELVTGGDTGEGEADQTLLQKVNANTLAIAALNTTVGNNTKGLVLAVNTLNASETTEGSVDYKIKQAFQWIDIQ